MNLIARFVREDAGQDLIEYAILIGLISVVSIVAVRAAGSWVNTQFETLNSTLAS
jgi:Flp pilus assembly pilin Flp